MTLPGLTFEHAAGDGGLRDRTQVVIIHATDNTASAEAEAGYATHRPDQTSAHVYVDDNSAVQALRLDHIAYGALWHGNQISVQFELCGRSNHLTDATMRQAAPLVAEVCKRYGIPVRKISAAQVRAGVKGICGHADITAAFPQDGGDHTDPGNAFPWSTFISYVAAGDSTQEDDDVTTRTSLSKADNQPAPWGKFTTLSWPHENTDPDHAHADGAYPGFVSPRSAYVDLDLYLMVEGMQAGDEYQVRMANHAWKAGKGSTGAATEYLADAVVTSGAQAIRVSGSLYLAKGHHLYVELMPVRRASAADAPAPRVTSGVWRLRQDG